MKILYHVEDVRNTTTNQFLYRNFADGFEALGHTVQPISFADDFAAKLKAEQPDVFITSSFKTYFAHTDFKALNSARASGLNVVVWVEPLPGFSYGIYGLHTEPGKIEKIKAGEWGDAYISCLDDARFDAAFLEATGAHHHAMPLAANPKLHFPENLPRTYDVAYVGNRLPRKEHTFQSVLFPLKKTRRVAIKGYNWSTLDRVINKFNRVARARRLPLPEIRTPNVITLDEERRLYSSTKACLNFHEDAQITLGMDVNERTFKVPACGGFEISDNPKAVRKYYAEDEMATVESEAEWAKTIDYYLADDALRERMQKKATERTLREHIYPKRCEKLLGLVAKK
ncbi:Glycosyl transferases group 1 [uncultured archaeon]|nr:Glycosyl transferases group 1 [uncultured archaeon]